VREGDVGTDRTRWTVGLLGDDSLLDPGGCSRSGTVARLVALAVLDALTMDVFNTDETGYCRARGTV